MVDGSCGLTCSFNGCPPFSHVADYVDDGSVMTLWVISTRKIDTPTPLFFCLSGMPASRLRVEWVV